MRKYFIVISLLMITGWIAFSQNLSEENRNNYPNIENDSTKQNNSNDYDSSKVNPNNYGGGFSLGASFGGGGVFGLPIRIYPAEEFAMELTIGLRPLIIYGYSSYSLDLNTYYTFGFDIFLFKHYSAAKHIVIKHGPFVKAGQSFDERFSTTLGGFGWNYEHYRFLKQSFNVELGIGLNRMHDNDYNPNNPNNPYLSQPDGWVHETENIFLFWKVGWNFF